MEMTNSLSEAEHDVQLLQRGIAGYVAFCSVESDGEVAEDWQPRISAELIVPDSVVHVVRVAEGMLLPSRHWIYARHGHAVKLQQTSRLPEPPA